MGVIYGLVYMLAAWKWGDWRNWRLYYSTILFLILGDMLYHYIFIDFHPMWKYVPYSFDKHYGLSATHISFSVMLIKYPATILLFLGNYPAEWKKKVGRVLLWVTIYSLNEFITLSLGGITYDNGWTYTWSILFDVAMFTILLVHYEKPLLAWLLSILFILFLWFTFDVPFSLLR